MAKKFTRFRKNIDIGGDSITNYLAQLDTSLPQPKRIEKVYEILCDLVGDGEMAEYLPKEYFAAIMSEEVDKIPIINVCLNQTDSLSEDEPFFKLMQRFVNYILYSPDAEKIDKKTKYNFYKDEKSFRRAQRDFSLESLMADNNGAIDYLIPKQKNFKKEKMVAYNNGFNYSSHAKKYYSELLKAIKTNLSKIEEKSSKIRENQKKLDKNCKKFRENEMALKANEKQKEYATRKLLRILEDKKIVCSDIDALQYEIAKCVKKSKTIKECASKMDKLDSDRYKLEQQAKSVNMLRNSFVEQQKAVFDAYTKQIFFKSPLPDEGYIDWDMVDLFDEKQMKELMRISYTANEDLAEHVEYVKQLGKMCGFSYLQKTILGMLNNTRLDYSDVAREMGLEYRLFIYEVDKISKLLVKKHEECLTDWYYTFIVKGKYKTCKTCGEVKLIQYFPKNPSTKDGLRSNCLNCY